MINLKPLIWEQGEHIHHQFNSDALLVSINPLAEFAIEPYWHPDDQECLKLTIHYAGGQWDCFTYLTEEQCKERAEQWMSEKVMSLVGLVQIPLTKGKFATIDAEDYVRVVSCGKWYYSRGYAITRQRVDGKQVTVFLHRFIMNAQKGEILDHKDGDGLNNTRQNLRFCTHDENMRNRKLSKSNTTGFKGVVFNGSSFIAQMRHNKETIYLGSYGSPIDAAKAYNKAALERQGEFAKLNQIPAQ
jgi:hypothetical protein